MTILVIETQVYENYGAHDWDGEGQCPQYWKAKGGNTFKVRVDFDKDYEWAEVYVERILDKVLPEITENNDYYEESVIGWHLEDNDWMSWYEKSQLEYDGEIRYPDRYLELAA